MDNQTTVFVIVGALLLVGLIIWYAMKQKRTDQLRNHYGPEYDRMVREKGSSLAERELIDRTRRVERLALVPLAPDKRQHYAEQWKQQQARFVDQPVAAVEEADHLVEEVMMECGYPVAEFEQRVADISVDHPQVVENYRAARAIAQANERGEATTENLREAMVHYRALFLKLLEDPAAVETAREAEREVAEPAGARR